MTHHGFGVGFLKGLSALIKIVEFRKVAGCLCRRFECPTKEFLFLSKVEIFTHFEQKSKIMKFVLRVISASRN